VSPLAPTLKSVAVRYSPFFDSSLCDGLLPHVHNQPFVYLIKIRRFTRLHSLCWLTPSTFIPPSFRLSMCSTSSACPSWIRLCRNPFSAFGLSELCSALPKLPFRLSACPRCVRLCRNFLFGFRLVQAGFGFAETSFSVFGLSKLLFTESGFHARAENTALSII